MSEVDDRIVSMQFDNAAFERRLSATIASLDKLTESLHFAGAQKGFAEVSSAADRFNLSKMANSIEGISHRFSAMGIAGLAVINNLVTGALNAVKRIGGDILGPIITGGKSRAGNIEQAKFQFRGLGIDVEKGMASALAAVQGTAFGLDEAAKVAAQFGASGIKVGDDMTNALRGISGAAALTGKSFSEIGDIFTSSAGSGVVNNQDLLQFATRGLNAAAAVGKVLGKTEEEIHEMATNGELDFKTFANAMNTAFGEHATKANETYSGSLANLHAAMSRLGASFFGPEQEQQRDLFNALTPVLDNVTKALQPVIKAFLDIRRVGIDHLIDILKHIDLSNFTKSMHFVASGVRQLFEVFQSLKAVAAASFREIFPASATSSLLTFTQAFAKFAEWLRPSASTLNLLGDIFTALFGTLKTGWTIIKEVFGLFGDLFGSLHIGGGGARDLADNLAGVIIRFNYFLVEGGAIKRFFDNLGEWIRKPAEFLRTLSDAVTGFFDGSAGSSGLENTMDRVTQRFELLGKIADRLSGVFAKVQVVFAKIWEYISTWFGELGQKLAAVLQPGDFDAALDVVNVGLLGGITLLLKKFLDGGIKFNAGGLIDKIAGTFDQLTSTMKAMQTQLKSEALLKIAEAVGILTISVVALSLIDSAALTKALTAMAVGFGQLVGAMALLDKLTGSAASAVKMGAISTGLIALAIAVGIMTLAIRNLSGLSWAELTKGLTGVTVALGIMVTSVQFLAGNTEGLVRAGIAMIAIATAIRILANAVQAFATMSLSELAKGLGAVAVSLGLVVTAMQFLSGNTEGLVRSGIAMIAIATAMRIMANAVEAFAQMSWGEMTKGLAGIGATLLIVAGAMHLMPPEQMVAMSTGLLLLSLALNSMARAVQAMGGIPFGEMAKGIGGLTVVLAVLVAAMNVMQGSIGGAAALVIVSGALLVLTRVIKELGKIKLAQLATGIGAIAVVMGVLAGTSIALSGAIPSLLALGAALVLIGGSFALFGIGAFAIAKAFDLISKSGKAGAKAIVDIIGVFVTARTEIVKALVGAILDFAKEMIESADMIIRVVKVFLGHVLDTIIELVPKIAEAFAKIIEAGVKLIREKAPMLIETGFFLLKKVLEGIDEHLGDIITTVVSIIETFAKGFSENIGKVVDSAVMMLNAFINAIVSHLADITGAGLKILLGLLVGISDNIVKVANTATDIVIKFLKTLSDNYLRIIDAGFQILIKFLKGIGDNLVRVVNIVGDIIANFITALGANYQKIAEAGLEVLKRFLKGIFDNLGEVVNTVGAVIRAFISAVGDNARNIALAGVDALLKFLKGIKDAIPEVAKAILDVVTEIIFQIGKHVPEVVEAGFKMFTALFDALAKVINERSGELGRAMGDLAAALVKGIGNALKEAIKQVANDLFPGLGSVVNGILHFFGIQSPSKMFYWIGDMLMTGFSKGIFDNINKPTDALEEGAEGMVDKMTETIKKLNRTLPEMGEFNPVITPVLDLSKVQASARGIDDLMQVSTIAPTVSLDRARQIATTTELERGSGAEPVSVEPKEVTFIQNNYSPDALSTNDIYKNTKSQLALAKEDLGIS